MFTILVGRSRRPGVRAMRAVAVSAAILAALCILASVTSASQAYPDPTGPVNDFAGVLSTEDKARLETLSVDIEKRTGAAVVVAVMPNTRPETPKMFAVHLFEKWGIGQKGKDNGVLILLDMDQRRVEVEVGYGLERVLTDGRIGEILDRDVVPHFKNGRFGDGLYAGMRAISRLIEADQGSDSQSGPDGREAPAPSSGGFAFDAVLGFALIAVGLFFVMGVFRKAIGRVTSGLYSRRRCPRCNGTLYVTDRIIRPATAFAPGIGLKIYRCNSCGFTEERQYRTGAGMGPFIGWPGSGRGGSGFGGFGGSHGGGFGGFGGGSSGGGGSGRSW